MQRGFKPFSRKPAFETFSPGRKDLRVNEARAMLSMRRTLDGLTANGLRCQWNLKPETAELILEEERARRAR